MGRRGVPCGSAFVLGMALGCGGGGGGDMMDGGGDAPLGTDTMAVDAGLDGGDGGDGSVLQPGFEITSYPTLTASEGEPYRYRLVIDQPGQPTFSLDTGPASATLDDNGALQWTPDASEAPGAHDFALSATLGGDTRTQRFTVFVPKVREQRSETVQPGTGGTVAVIVEAPLSPIRGAGVIIPDGALTQETSFSVGVVESPPPLAAAEVGGGSVEDARVVSFGPSGTVFAEPVSLVVPISEAVAATASGPEDIEVWTLSANTGTWTLAPVTRVDLAGRTAVVRVRHFSEFAAIAAPGILETPVATAGGSACDGWVFGDGPLAFDPMQIESAWLNGYDAMVHPATLAEALAGLSGMDKIKIVRKGTLVLEDGVGTGARHVVVNLTANATSGVDVTVADGSGTTLLTATALASDDPELARLIQGRATHFVFRPVPDAAAYGGTLSVRSFGYFTSSAAGNGVPSSLGTFFAEATATHGAGTLSASADDDDCDGTLNGDDATPSGTPPPVVDAVGVSTPRVLAGTDVALEVGVISADPMGPTVTWTANGGTVTADPMVPTRATFQAGAAGTYQVTATASDAGGEGRATFEVLVEVTAPNTPPSCAIAAPTVDVLAGDPIGLSATGSDPEQAPEVLSYRWETSLTGTLSALTGQDVTFAGDETASVQVRCYANDGIEEGPAGTVTIDVLVPPENIPPTLLFVQPVGATLEVDAGQIAVTELYAEAEDLDGDPLSFEFFPIEGMPALIPVDDGPNHAIRRFEATQTGTYAVGVRVTDGRGATSNTVTSTILVTVPLGNVDDDMDGYPSDIDCDDLDPMIHPGVAEVCGDGIDQNCDGIDPSPAECDFDRDGASEMAGDCDDGNPNVYPGAFDACNSVDDDCDGGVDEGYATGDACSVGIGACAATGTRVCSGSGLGTVCSATAGAPTAETCNGVDDDCDGTVDNVDTGGVSDVSNCGGCGVMCMGADNQVAACEDVGGTGSFGCTYDCAAGFIDLDRSGGNGCEYECTPTGAVEVCDGADDDCDGIVDEGASEYFYDGPAGTQGVGICRQGRRSCMGGTLVLAEDQTLPTSESCDGRDEDCNGAVDDGVPGTGGDCIVGVGECQATGTLTCAGGPIVCSGTPGASAPEVCDGLDNDCDGMVDDEGVCPPEGNCPDGIVVGPTGGTYMGDLDALPDMAPGACGYEGPEQFFIINLSTPQEVTVQSMPGMYDFGIRRDDCIAGPTEYCAPSGEEMRFFLEAGTHYLVVEGMGLYDINILICNDADGDGYGDASCGGGDCDDTDPSRSPGIPEMCGDGVDNNCNGMVDEPTDADGDGYVSEACAGGDDCDDGRRSVNPGAIELCDNMRDDNCDGMVDEMGCTVPTAESCADPIDLGAGGTFSGDLTGASDDVMNGCGGGPEHVYTFTINEGEVFGLEATMPMGGVTYALMDRSCEDGGLWFCTMGEPFPGEPIPPGEYWLLVEGDGPYEFTASICADADRDGFGDAACGGPDCDDTDPSIHPYSIEQCGDGIDNDCDGMVDEPTDADGDGYVGAACMGGDDCDDGNRFVNPGRNEICGNMVDDNCNAQVDEMGCVMPMGDNCAEAIEVGAGGTFTGDLADATDQSFETCFGGLDRFFHFQVAGQAAVHFEARFGGGSTGYTLLQGDCQAPGPVFCMMEGEVFDQVLQPGDYWLVVEGDGAYDFDLTICTDADGDGYGDAACGGGDCDDSDPMRNPGTAEVCGDGIDNDCDAMVDEPTDADGDGYIAAACAGGDDCDDTRRSTNPGAQEICGNGFDDNCDTVVDEMTCVEPMGDTCADAIEIGSGGTFSGDLVDATDAVFESCHGGPDHIYHFTVAEGDVLTFEDMSMAPMIGYTLVRDMCDMGGVWMCMGAGERYSDRLMAGEYWLIVEGDGTYDFTVTVCADADGDGYGDTACGGGDCDDADPSRHPGMTEMCGDGVDNNCNGMVDEPTDADGDGYVAAACAGGDDCDDSRSGVNPGRPEICGNALDDNCDMVVDEMTCVEPTGETCADAIELGAGGSVSGDLTGATADVQGTCSGQRDRVYHFTANEGDVFSLDDMSMNPMLTYTLIQGNCEMGGRWMCMYPGEMFSERLMAGDHWLAVEGSGTYDFTMTVCQDADGDGYGDMACGGGDCDDSDPSRHPGMIEQCGDGIDNNCNGMVDEPTDGDGDGYVAAACAGGNDCDDSRSGVNPGRPEICGNGLDDNCDAQVDEMGCTTPTGETCDDAVEIGAGGSFMGDLTVATDDVVETCMGGNDIVYHFVVGDGEALSFESTPVGGMIGYSFHEGMCNAPPMSCMGDGEPFMDRFGPGEYWLVVEGTGPYAFSAAICADGDGDGYADTACGGNDCDDADPMTNPGMGEQCGDGVDNNCDGMVDEGCVGCTMETCDGIDNDCDGTVDNGGVCPVPMGDTCMGALDATGGGTFGGDLLGANNDVPDSCFPGGMGGEGRDVVYAFTTASTQLITLDASASMGGVGFMIAGDCPMSMPFLCMMGGDVQSTTQGAGTYYVIVDATTEGPGDYSFDLTLCDDVDGDNYGAVACGGSDCDDGDPSRNPGVVEDCTDGVDNNCDGMTDEPVDQDGDGYTALACAGGTDCDDQDPAVNTGAAERCGDGIDNDCDSMVDEATCDPIAAGENCAVPIDIPVPAGRSYMGDLSGLANEVGAQCHPDGGPGEGRDQVYRLQLAGSYVATVDFSASGGNVGWELRNGLCDSPMPSACGQGGEPPQPFALGAGDHFLILDTLMDGSVPYDFTVGLCIDADSDGAGAMACGGNDCDDADNTRAPGRFEDCDGIDNDCDMAVDEACGCMPAMEVCNGVDDDCNGMADDPFECVQGSMQPCSTVCGSTGTRTCGMSCTLGACTPPAEICGNAADDDCDGMVDNGCP